MKAPVDRITAEWFKNWAKDYDATLGKADRHQRMLELAVARSAVKAGDKVLDIGCGTGLLSLKFIRRADCTVTGVDTSPEMLAVFTGKIKHTPLQKKIMLQVGDAAALPFAKNTFHIAAATVTLHHLKDKAPALRGILKVLKPGGRLVIGDVDLDTTGTFDDPRRIRRLLKFMTAELMLVARKNGPEAVKRMFANCQKHFFNEGEYCVSFKQWAALCRQAGFIGVNAGPVPGASWFKVLVAKKAL